MSYEIFSRKVLRRGVSSVTATKLGRLAISKAATQPFEKRAVEHVLLMWDAANRRIGIRPITKRDPRSYQVKYGDKGNGAGFSAKTFLDYIGIDTSASRSMGAIWNEEQEVLEIDVPAEYLNDTKQQKLIELENPPVRKSVVR